MKILLTGGGSSGHVNPALAIADIIKKKHPDATFAYIGTDRGIEKRLVDKEGIPFYNVSIQGISRSLSPSNIKTAYLIMTAPAKAKRILKSVRPDVVIGTGGYACWPALKAAAELGWRAEYGIEEMCRDAANWQEKNPDGYPDAK